MSSRPGSDDQGHLPGLTGLRCIAAYAVYVHHFNAVASSSSSWHRLMAEGYVGVSLFFVLSGFLITYRYSASFGSATSSERLSSRLLRYFSARIARIWPVYLLLTSITLALTRSTFQGWVMNITLLKGLSDAWKFSGIPQSWSLTVEEIFYALAPLVFMVLGRSGPQSSPIKPLTHPANVRWRVIVILVASSWSIGAILPSLCRFLRVPLFENIRFVIIYTFFGRCFEFFCGMTAAFLFPSGTFRRHMTYLSLGVIALIVFLLSRLQSTLYAFGIFSPFGMLVHNLLLPPVAALFIYSLAGERTWIQSILDSRGMRLLGGASYSFYLIHYGVPMTFLRCWLPWKSGLAAFVIANLGAIGLFLGVERPAQRWLRAAFERLLPAK